MIYGSVCSGIEAATVAWEPLGWKALFFSEIEPFPRAVLAHHYPDVPLHGDFTTIKKDEYAPIDILVGGTPCQSFSVAGLRAGLDDPRGNLMLEFGSLARRLAPQWLVWENVPGVLSSNKGRDFGTFLGMLGELGYGFAYRILDAQYFGVPQRRRRVFVVGCLGDWRRAAAVLFERHSLSRNPAPCRKTPKEVAGTFGSRARSGGGFSTDFECSGGLQGQQNASKTLTFSTPAIGDIRLDDIASTMSRNTGGPVGGNQGGDFVAQIVHGTQDPCVSDIAFAQGRNNGGENVLIAVHAASMQVRRLTPRECERLQGFLPVLEILRIEGCIDHQSNSVVVAMKCHRLQSSAWNATESDYLRFASTAARSLITVEESSEVHVALHARQHYAEKSQVLRKSQSGLPSGVSSAVNQKWFRFPMPNDSFAASLAPHWESLATKATHGKAESPLRIRLSLAEKSGAINAVTYGSVSEGIASVATTDANEEKFTTSLLGRVTPTCDSPIATSLCSVIRATSSFTQSETPITNFCIDLVLERDYTLITMRNKPAADNPRYKTLGNSMAVPVMRWIGERIEKVNKILK